MARYKVILAYDGTDFSGFQRQKRLRTVQAEVEKTLSNLGWEGRSLLAAGRTDSGVHARGQVVSFDLVWQHAESDLQNALNALLPPSIAVQSLVQVADGFHPRYDATSRCYRYTILEAPVRCPLEERYSWRVWPEVNLQVLQEAANLLVGEHDFSPFASPLSEEGSTVRTVFRADWKRDEPFVAFEIVANAFLYHMVRRIVYSLVQVGLRRSRPEEIREMLRTSNSNLIQGLAPANGLCLQAVSYPE